MNRLIVLSNRVKLPDGSPMAGGLAVALNEVLADNAGIWMGWNGQIMDEKTDSTIDVNKFSVIDAKQSTHSLFESPNHNITYMTTAYTRQQYQHYYCGFCNNVLWTLLHEQPDLVSQGVQDYASYQSVNHLFARQLSKVARPDDVIWVHDYHFLSVAYHCRKLGMRNRIGFFLHIPFPPLNFWQRLGASSELINHLAHYDVIGTQTHQDKVNASSVIKHYLKGSFYHKGFLEKGILNSRFKANGCLKTSGRLKSNNNAIPDNNCLILDLIGIHNLSINAYPIGVNVTKIQQQVGRLNPQASFNIQKNHTSKPTQQRIIAVDRIDYSKGLLERFSAYQEFLQYNSKYQNNLQFLQIACPSRLDLPIYQQLYKKVKDSVNSVNQSLTNQNLADKTNYSDAQRIEESKPFNKDNNVNWQAITYSENILSHDALMHRFWHSDIGWVNSLKDGMNLVAKEYVAAQNPDNPGVLLLSRYAGASEQMSEAVIIDPYDATSIIKGLKTALEMPLIERKARYKALIDGLQQDDLQAWHQAFMTDLYDQQTIPCRYSPKNTNTEQIINR